MDNSQLLTRPKAMNGDVKRGIWCVRLGYREQKPKPSANERTQKQGEKA